MKSSTANISNRGIYAVDNNGYIRVSADDLGFFRFGGLSFSWRCLAPPSIATICSLSNYISTTLMIFGNILGYMYKLVLPRVLSPVILNIKVTAYLQILFRLTVTRANEYPIYFSWHNFRNQPLNKTTSEWHTCIDPVLDRMRFFI